MKRSLTFAFLLGMTTTISYCLAVWLKNLLFAPTLSWRMPLNLFTFPGLLASVLTFPCRERGLEIGCEWYRTLPLFVVVNSLVCTVICLPLVHLLRVSRRKG